MSSCKKLLASNNGFTLVESVVTLAVLAIVMVAVAGILNFGMRIAHQQEATSKADQLNEMVRVSIVDDLRYASKVEVLGSGSKIEFDIPFAAGTREGANGNLPAGSYVIYSADDGMVHISGAQKGGSAVVSPILPSKTFIDNAAVTCAFEKQEGVVRIEVTVAIGDVQRTASSTVRPLNAREAS